MSVRVGGAALLALLALQFAWHAWWLPPERASAWLVAALYAAPLAACALLWWRRPSRGLVVAGMLGLFYFCHGVAEAWSDPPARVLALLEVALVLVVIVAPLPAALAARRASR